MQHADSVFKRRQGLSLFLVSATSPSLERWQNDMFAAVDILSLLQKQVQEKTAEVIPVSCSRLLRKILQL